MLKDFKAFILQGNVVDLAIGVAIGAAFAAVITSFTVNLLTPLLAIPGDATDLSEMFVTVSGAEFKYGLFINAVIGFVITAAVIFFLVVRPVTALMNRRKTEPEVAATTKDCPYCLSSVPLGATRCAFCTAELRSTTG